MVTNSSDPGNGPNAAIQARARSFSLLRTGKADRTNEGSKAGEKERASEL